jgi:hypothetical protein
MNTNNDQKFELKNETEKQNSFFQGGIVYFVFFAAIVILMIAISYLIKWIM